MFAHRSMGLGFYVLELDSYVLVYAIDAAFIV